jgi:RiboL-PSP-HEPN
MPRREILELLEPIDRLYDEIRLFVPEDTLRLQFRSDLSGLLVVSMAASYENCVKEILISFCSSHNEAFGAFASNQYAKLNSKINLHDLVNYAKLFGDQFQQKYKEELAKRRNSIKNRTGRDICERYEQVLAWRHQYAHAGQQNTTLDEAYSAHTFAKRVILAFSDALQ